METYTLNHFIDTLIISNNKLIVLRETPTKLENIDPLFPGDDREKKVLETIEESFLEVVIPPHLLDEIKSSKPTFDSAHIALNYENDNGINTLHSLSSFDLDDL